MIKFQSEVSCSSVGIIIQNAIEITCLSSIAFKASLVVNIKIIKIHIYQISSFQSSI